MDFDGEWRRLKTAIYKCLECCAEVMDVSCGRATGKLTRLRDEIDAADTVEELEAIKW